MSWQMRQYEADVEYCEEMHGRADDFEEILEQIQDHKGRISKEKVQAYLTKQTTEIENAEREIQRFCEEAEAYKRMGASSQQIYGDGSEVSFSQTQHMEIGRAWDNIEQCKKICLDHDITVAVSERKVTEHKVSVRDL